MKIDIPGWLEELDAGYCEKYQREVIKPYAEGMAQLKQDYVASIDRLLDAATQAAKLEDTIALRAERQRAAESDGLPVDDSDVSLPSIKALRRGYRVEAMNLGLVRARRAKEQFVRYDLHLAANQSHFTRLQRPDDATLVKTRREQIAAEWPRRPGEP
jgi:hypothetical protein